MLHVETAGQYYRDTLCLVVRAREVDVKCMPTEGSSLSLVSICDHDTPRSIFCVILIAKHLLYISVDHNYKYHTT